MARKQGIEYVLANSIPEPNSGCWLWLLAIRNGYGVAKHDIPAHRYSYECFEGPIPVGARLLHSCDQPSCVNPDHLRPDTQQENIRDQYRRNRRETKLSRDDIKTIRNLPGLHKNIAKVYGVARSTISRAKRGDTWGYIND